MCDIEHRSTDDNVGDKNETMFGRTVLYFCKHVTIGPWRWKMQQEDGSAWMICTKPKKTTKQK